MLEGVRQADGVIIATPGYHGSVSGLIKNALDSLEGLRNDPRPYFEGRAVGCLVTADGWQAGGTTLSSIRATIHALRGWPTPLGVAFNPSAGPLFNDAGDLAQPRDTGLPSGRRMTGPRVWVSCGAPISENPASRRSTNGHQR